MPFEKETYIQISVDSGTDYAVEGIRFSIIRMPSEGGTEIPFVVEGYLWTYAVTGFPSSVLEPNELNAQPMP